MTKEEIIRANNAPLDHGLAYTDENIVKITDWLAEHHLNGAGVEMAIIDLKHRGKLELIKA
jgi:hypothetical protein